MSDMEFYFSPKGQRKLSYFVAQGLIFDYLEGNLDSERRQAFEHAVHEFPELKVQMNKMKSGIEMCGAFEKIQVSADLSKNLSLTTQYFESIRNQLNIEKLPPALKLGIEGLFIALAVATMAIVIPWNSLMDLNVGPKQVILAEVVKNGNSDLVGEVPTKPANNYEFPDDSNIQKSNQNPSQAQQVAPPVETQVQLSGTSQAQVPMTIAAAGRSAAKSLEPSANVAKNMDKNSEKNLVPMSGTPTAATPEGKPLTGATKDSQAGAELSKATTSNESSSSSRGVLYRGTIYVTNFRAVTPKLVEKLQELGGRKAGQVELGWFKGESSYFHFTMPDGRYEELSAFFKTYGALVIQKEPHERVMPDGIRRIIITVYEKK